jgi:hypothetical protein
MKEPGFIAPGWFTIRSSVALALAVSLMGTTCLRKSALACDRPEESSCFKNAGDGDPDVPGIIFIPGLTFPLVVTPDIWRASPSRIRYLQAVSAHPRGPPFTSLCML